jgi:hypothetical protein
MKLRCKWPCVESIQTVYVEGFLQSVREQMRGFHELLRQKPSFLFIQSNLSHLHNMIHISSFSGEDAGVMELDVASKVDAVLCHGCLVGIF